MKQSHIEIQTWGTPPAFLDLVRQVFGGIIGLDPCTTSDNPTGATHFYTPAQDGLASTWRGLGPVFVNPPYGRGIGSWTARLGLDMRSVRWVPGGDHLTSPDREAIALLPARTDTEWWHRDITGAESVCFLRGRLRFIDPATGKPAVDEKGHPSSGKFPSAAVYWGPHYRLFRKVFKKVGWCP